MGPTPSARTWAATSIACLSGVALAAGVAAAAGAFDDGPKTSTETIVKRERGARVSAAVQKSLPAYTVGFVVTDLCPGLSGSSLSPAEKREAERIRRRTARRFDALLRQVARNPEKLMAVRGTLSEEPRDIVEDMTVRQFARSLSAEAAALPFPDQRQTQDGRCAFDYHDRLERALRRAAR